jgi:hypothetical protein
MLLLVHRPHWKNYNVDNSNSTVGLARKFEKKKNKRFFEDSLIPMDVKPATDSEPSDLGCFLNVNRRHS